MDIWFWVNDLWAWAVIYLVGAFFTCRTIVSYVGWREDTCGNIVFEYDFGADDQGPAALFGTICWPVAILILAIGAIDGNPFIGRPPKEFRKKLREQKLRELEERVGLGENPVGSESNAD